MLARKLYERIISSSNSINLVNLLGQIIWHAFVVDFSHFFAAYGYILLPHFPKNCRLYFALPTAKMAMVLPRKKLCLFKRVGQSSRVVNASIYFVRSYVCLATTNTTIRMHKCLCLRTYAASISRVIIRFCLTHTHSYRFMFVHAQHELPSMFAFECVRRLLAFVLVRRNGGVCM